MDTLWPRILSFNEYLGGIFGGGRMDLYRLDRNGSSMPFLSIGEDGDNEKYYQ